MAENWEEIEACLKSAWEKPVEGVYGLSTWDKHRFWAKECCLFLDRAIGKTASEPWREDLIKFRDGINGVLNDWPIVNQNQNQLTES